jgi:hypothetical protein
MRYLQEPNRDLPDSVSPADFPLGSPQSRMAMRLLLSRKKLPPLITLVFVHPYWNEKGEHIRDENGRPVPCPLCQARWARAAEKKAREPKPRGLRPITIDDSCKDCPNNPRLRAWDRQSIAAEIVQ